MTSAKLSELRQIALRVRGHIIRMSTNGGCFIGASLSCADLLVYLYKEVLRLTPKTLNDPKRDYLFLSKGHDVPALYGVLAELGYIERERLRNHLKTNDSIYWHPNRSIPGVEFHSGSLGHLLSVAMGVAYDVKLSGDPSKVFLIMGDGELNEGSVWEACLVAHAKKLDNLIAIIDRNEFQANLPTEELIPLEPLEAKFKSFGWSVRKTNGHDFENMEKILVRRPFESGRPSVVIAKTVRGKGLPSIERRADRWFANFTHEEVEMLLRELHGEQPSPLTSETLIVR